jgi:hypothetical protein
MCLAASDGVGVGPCQIGEAFALDVDVVIAGNALPRAGGVAVAGAKIRHVDGLWGKYKFPSTTCTCSLSANTIPFKTAFAMSLLLNHHKTV